MLIDARAWDFEPKGPHLMTEPAYVQIAGDYARQIRGGQLTPGRQIPSQAEIAADYDVSNIVVRKALELLLNLGLVRSERRRGIFVADRPNLVRVSPERQMEDPEVSFGNETREDVRIDREVAVVPATDELAMEFGLAAGDQITYTVTRATEGRRPISISDTYQPQDVADTSSATVLEESVSDRLPEPEHREWLGTPAGELVKVIEQRFIATDGRTIMLSTVAYPRDRYDSFFFRMSLTDERIAAER